MSLIEFKNLPDTTTPITANNLNNNFNELKAYSLYDDANGTNSSATLSDSVSNYNYIEIFIKGENRFNSVKVFNPNGKKVYLHTCTVLRNYNYYKMSNWDINNNVISFVEGNGYAVSANGIDGLAPDNSVYIYKVVGYK